ncbi:MAG TPA: hypothetical protein VLW50_26955 [Streptosporangiaceae bacterium]|nr:hypothetical protein [Streptosporangiaceae bacterium]
MSASAAVSRTEPGSAGAVRAMAVISTGTVQIHPEHPYGTRKPLYWWLSGAAPELRGVQRRHIQVPGLKWHHIRMEPASDPSPAPFTKSLDVMGDGSLVLLPAPGHTAGSISLLVRRGTKTLLLLAGDLTYGASILEHHQLPGVGNKRRLGGTSHKVLDLKKQMPDLAILPAHDPAAAARLPGS